MCLNIKIRSLYKWYWYLVTQYYLLHSRIIRFFRWGWCLNTRQDLNQEWIKLLVTTTENNGDRLNTIAMCAAWHGISRRRASSPNVNGQGIGISEVVNGYVSVIKSKLQLGGHRLWYELNGFHEVYLSKTRLLPPAFNVEGTVQVPICVAIVLLHSLMGLIMMIE